MKVGDKRGFDPLDPAKPCRVMVIGDDRIKQENRDLPIEERTFR